MDVLGERLVKMEPYEMYSFKVDDLTSSIRVCVAFACGVLMMIFMEIESAILSNLLELILL